MIRFLLGRLAQSAAVLLVMSFVVYLLMGLMPGDPVDLAMSANPRLTSADVAHLREVYGVDRPILERYGTWLRDASHGELGYSRLQAKPVLEALGPALRNTVVLLGLSFALSVCLALALGVTAAVRAGSRLDWAVNLFAFAGISLPSFWLALLLVIVFAVLLGVLPASGVPMGETTAWGQTRYLVLPVANLTILSLGAHTRYVRASMIEALRQDFVRTARAKGMGQRRVVWVHALRNALIPVVTVAALDFGGLFSGALVTETIFAWPGMGKLIFDSVMGNDFNLALVALLLVTALTLAGNLLADIAYTALDPRVSHR